MQFNQQKFSNELINTIIGPETSIKGALHSQRSMQIDGTVEGEINCQGDVYIGEKSIIKANIIARSVTVSGEVFGNIETLKGLSISKTGKVYGNITGDQLNVEEGGIYRGKVNMDVISSKSPYEGDLQFMTKG
jgi:cytoskeletal protein CcmA (bactofilin family)